MLTVIVSLLLLMFALPVWALIDAAALGRRENLIWIIAIVLVWPLASLVYGLARARSRTLRALAIAITVVNIGLVWFGHQNAQRDAVEDEATVEHYRAVQETDALELEHVFGSYGSPGNDDYVQDLSLSRDGTRLLVSGGRSLRLWNLDDGSVVRTYERLPANDILAGWLHGKWLGRGDRVAPSPDGTTVAAARGSVTIRLGFTLAGVLKDAVTGRPARGHPVAGRRTVGASRAPLERERHELRRERSRHRQLRRHAYCVGRCDRDADAYDRSEPRLDPRERRLTRRTLCSRERGRSLRRRRELRPSEINLVDNFRP